MSYRKKNIKAKIDKIRPKKSIFKKLWFWLFILISIVIISISYFILFYPNIQVKNILISGNQKVLSKDVEDLVLKNVNNEILSIGWWEINSKSIILASKIKIKENILENFPVVENVLVSKFFPDKLTISISEKQPLGAFCNSDGECFYIDQNGIIFEKLLSVASNIIIVRQIGGKKELTIGTNVIDKNIISTISMIKKNLKDNHQIDLKEAVINNSLRLNITTSENWQIYFDLNVNSNINPQIIKMNSLLNGGITEESRKNLKYIDLRPKDRAIVCDNSICGN